MFSMKLFLLGLVTASIAIILGVVVLAWAYYRAEPCMDFPNSQDHYLIVVDKTTGQKMRVKNCARP